MKKKPKGGKGVNISVSPKAHQKMRQEAIAKQPVKTMRQIVNIKNNLPENE